MKPFYTWKTTSKDGNVINQYEGNVEIPFSEVDKLKDELELFRLDGEDKTYLEVDLVKGELDSNGKKKLKLSNNKLPVELIYARRNKVRVMVGVGTPLSQQVTHRLGIKNSEETIVLEIFPGLLQSEKKASLIRTNNVSKENTEEDVINHFD